MRTAKVLAGLGVGVGAGVTAARRLGSTIRGGDDGPGNRLDLAVTVGLPPEEVAPGGRLPEPLDGVADLADVVVRVAPGDRGTELVATLRPVPEGGDADEPRRRVRLALREAKQLLETGEILRPDRPGTTRPTPTNAPVRAATATGREEGRL